MFRSSGGASGGLSGLLPPGFDLNNAGDSDLQSLLNNMSQSQLMQIFGGVSGGAGRFVSLDNKIKEFHNLINISFPRLLKLSILLN